MKCIKVTTDNLIIIVDLNPNDYHEIVEELGCDYFECVRTDVLRDFFGLPVVMLIDEEGALNDLPFNNLGCYFYGTNIHGNPICGDLIFAVQHGTNIIGFDDVEFFVYKLLHRFVLEEG